MSDERVTMDHRKSFHFSFNGKKHRIDGRNVKLDGIPVGIYDDELKIYTLRPMPRTKTKDPDEAYKTHYMYIYFGWGCQQSIVDGLLSKIGCKWLRIYSYDKDARNFGIIYCPLEHYTDRNRRTDNQGHGPQIFVHERYWMPEKEWKKQEQQTKLF